MAARKNAKRAPATKMAATRAQGRVATASKSRSSKPETKGPFKTKKSSVPTKTQDNVLVPPAEVAEAVDAFRVAQDQAKFFDGEASLHKNTILDYATEEFAKRAYSGDEKGFKIQGIEAMAMYVVQDAGAGLSEEEVEEFAERFGRAAADDLIVRDYASIRFNESVLAANYDAVVKALSTLPDHIVDNLFKPMAMKACNNAVSAALRHVDTAEDLREILKALKLRQYVR